MKTKTLHSMYPTDHFVTDTSKFYKNIKTHRQKKLIHTIDFSPIQGYDLCFVSCFPQCVKFELSPGFSDCGQVRRGGGGGIWGFTPPPPFDQFFCCCLSEVGDVVPLLCIWKIDPQILRSEKKVSDHPPPISFFRPGLPPPPTPKTILHTPLLQFELFPFL